MNFYLACLCTRGYVKRMSYCGSQSKIWVAALVEKTGSVGATRWLPSAHSLCYHAHLPLPYLLTCTAPAPKTPGLPLMLRLLVNGPQIQSLTPGGTVPPSPIQPSSRGLNSSRNSPNSLSSTTTLIQITTTSLWVLQPQPLYCTPPPSLLWLPPNFLPTL